MLLHFNHIATVSTKWRAQNLFESLIFRRNTSSQHYFRIVASLDRKRLGTKISRQTGWTRGVFDKEASRKPLAFAADAVSYGI